MKNTKPISSKNWSCLMAFKMNIVLHVFMLQTQNTFSLGFERLSFSSKRNDFISVKQLKETPYLMGIKRITLFVYINNYRGSEKFFFFSLTSHVEALWSVDSFNVVFRQNLSVSLGFSNGGD